LHFNVITNLLHQSDFDQTYISDACVYNRLMLVTRRKIVTDHWSQFWAGLQYHPYFYDLSLFWRFVSWKIFLSLIQGNVLIFTCILIF